MRNQYSKNRRPSLFWRIFISALGAALIILAAVRLGLFFFGEDTAAYVTIRRVGGADSGRPPEQRYEWSLDYSFRDENGNLHNGTTTRRGGDMSVDTDDRVYYFTFAPFISALESDAEPNLSQLLFVIIGVFLIYIMNRKNPRENERPYD